MFETIEKLRDKPERSKKRIAFLVSFLFAGIIFVVWLSVIYPDLKRANSQQDVVSKYEPSPLSAFEDSLSNGFVTFGAEIKSLKDSALLFSTQPEYFYATTTDNSVKTSAQNP